MGIFLIVLSIILFVIWKKATKLLIFSSFAYLVLGLFVLIYFTINHLSMSQEIRPSSYIKYHIRDIVLACDISLGVVRIAGCVLIHFIYRFLRIEDKRSKKICSYNGIGIEEKENKDIDKGFEPLIKQEHEDQVGSVSQKDNNKNDNDDMPRKNKVDYMNSFEEEKKYDKNEESDNYKSQHKPKRDIDREKNAKCENDDDNDYKNYKVGSEVQSTIINYFLLIRIEILTKKHSIIHPMRML